MFHRAVQYYLFHSPSTHVLPFLPVSHRLFVVTPFRSRALPLNNRLRQRLLHSLHHRIRLSIISSIPVARTPTPCSCTVHRLFFVVSAPESLDVASGNFTHLVGVSSFVYVSATTTSQKPLAITSLTSRSRVCSCGLLFTSRRRNGKTLRPRAAVFTSPRATHKPFCFVFRPLSLVKSFPSRYHHDSIVVLCAVSEEYVKFTPFLILTLTIPR